MNHRQNNKNEIWKRWEPIVAVHNVEYFLIKTLNTVEGFSIIIKESHINKHKKILIDFGNSVKAFRSFYLDYQLLVREKLNKEYGQEFYTNGPVYTISNSRYLQWFNNESGYVEKGLQLEHFCFFTKEQTMDVIAVREPQVTFL